MEGANVYSEGFEAQAISDDARTVKQHQLTEKLEEWSWSDNKKFENLLAQIDAPPPELFIKIAFQLPGKTIDQISKHYDALIEDIMMIEAGLVPLPDYKDNCPPDEEIPTNGASSSTKTQKDPKLCKKRKKGIPWTKEEHESFLVGMEKYGKGDWRSISRHCVISRTPIQCASHAQKYFLRLERNSKKSSKDPAAP